MKLNQMINKNMIYGLGKVTQIKLNQILLKLRNIKHKIKTRKLT